MRFGKDLVSRYERHFTPVDLATTPVDLRLPLRAEGKLIAEIEAFEKLLRQQRACRARQLQCSVDDFLGAHTRLNLRPVPVWLICFSPLIPAIQLRWRSFMEQTRIES